MAIVLIVALLTLGPKRTLQAGRALGTGIREFKDALTGREVARVNTQPAGLRIPLATL
ncbi:MAG: twin-arginine translocase TatA/TatE family subunit [Solirubrobacteraceae bacterium]